MAVTRDKFSSSLTITDADGAELTLDGCTFEMSEVVTLPSGEERIAALPPESLEMAFTVEFDTSHQPHWSGRARHLWGLHTEPRNLGRSARQQDYRRGNSLARYYGRMYGETGLLSG